MSPTSLRTGSPVAVSCKGGLLRVYSASTGKLIWNKRNIGKKQDNGLMQVHYDTLDQLYTILDNASIY